LLHPVEVKEQPSVFTAIIQKDQNILVDELKLNRDFEGIEDLIEQIKMREDELPAEKGTDRDEIFKEICEDHEVFPVL
jgi:hypothetical protein